MSNLSASQILSARLSALLLADHECTSVEQVVEWLGAMQGQDLASVTWSLGLRLPALTQSDVDGAFEQGAVLRTWPMRGTIHLIASNNARWMLDTVGSRALSGVQRRWDYLGLDRSTVERAGVVLEQALVGGKRLTRSQCADALNDAGIATTGQRLYHLLWHSSQVGITCFGPSIGKEQTFVLLSEFAPIQRTLVGEEALAELAWYFVRGHGPIPAKDFAGWAGIAMGPARKALVANDGRIREIGSEVGTLWATDELANAISVNGDLGFSKGTLALPGFDEYMLGYKDRTLMLEPGHLQAVVPGNNGVFRSTIVDRGKVMGTWKRTATKRKVRIEVDALADLTPEQVSGFEAAVRRYGRFVGLEVEIS
ncbi:MAG: winged helix DNA-binding domain-containing protein [Candidatus Nanopelagicales bacterium]